MAKKVKIDPITQAKQAKQFFSNLKESVAVLGKLVDFNIDDINKTIARLEEKENKEFEDFLGQSENQNKL